MKSTQNKGIAGGGENKNSTLFYGFGYTRYKLKSRSERESKIKRCPSMD